MSDYDREIAALVDAMRYKLKVHKAKGHLANRDGERYSIEEVLELLRGEVEELEEAIASGSPIETILEAADVANYAMMAVLIAHEGISHETGKRTKRHLPRAKVDDRKVKQATVR